MADPFEAVVARLAANQKQIEIQKRNSKIWKYVPLHLNFLVFSFQDFLLAENESGVYVEEVLAGSDTEKEGVLKTGKKQTAYFG